MTGNPAGDPTAAGRALDAAGWTAGADGIRVKKGRRAVFTLMYPASDNLRSGDGHGGSSWVTRLTWRET